MKRLTQSLLAASVLMASSFAMAEQYAVQIGAHKFYKEDGFQSATKHGTVHTDQKRDLTLVRVGYFNSKEDAQSLLNELKKAGYVDAFITPIETTLADTVKTDDRGDAYQEAKATVTVKESVQVQLDEDKRQSLSKLSADEFSKAIYVDGLLMIRDDNGQIKTLEQYRQSK